MSLKNLKIISIKYHRAYEILRKPPHEKTTRSIHIHYEKIRFPIFPGTNQTQYFITLKQNGTFIALNNHSSPQIGRRLCNTIEIRPEGGSQSIVSLYLGKNKLSIGRKQTSWPFGRFPSRATRPHPQKAAPWAQRTRAANP